MQLSYVLLSDGSRLDFTRLLEMAPCTILATPEFVSLCESTAEGRKFTSTCHRKIYINLLIKHSKFLAQITALYFLHKNNVISIRSVHSDKCLAVFSDFFPGITLVYNDNSDSNYIDRKHKYVFFVKSVMHFFYRLLSDRNMRARDISIRSWVEISERMFADSYESGNILIYPFFLNLVRHLKYIKSVRKRFQHVSFMGLPYRVLPALKNMLNGSDGFYVREEFNAYSQHAEELSLLTNVSLKTSDEFEAGAFVMCTVLKNNGVQVDNKAHGISFACPYTNYSSFLVYNEAQMSYYASKSLDTEFQIFQRRNAPSTDAVSASDLFSPAVVIIHNPYGRVGLSFEQQLQDNIFSVLEEFCSSREIPLYIKKHPNSISSDIKYLDSWPNASKILSLSEIGNQSPTFINISSVSYYDFKEYGPFIFVDDGMVPIDVMFGREVTAVKLTELTKVLTNYFDEEYWHRAKGSH